MVRKIRKIQRVISILERFGLVFSILGTFGSGACPILGEQPLQGGPGAGTGEGQSAPCRETRPSPERPRKGPENPESLQNQSEVLILLLFLYVFVYQSLGQDFLFIAFAKMFPHVPFQDTVSKYEKLGLQCHGPPDHQVFDAFICKNVNYLSKGPGRNYFGVNESWTQGAPALLHQSWEMILWGQSVVLHKWNPYFLHGASTRIFTRIMKLSFKSLVHTHENERW